MNIPNELISLPVGTVARPNVNIKSFKSCQGTDGEAFSLMLHIDGVKAAFVTQSGRGGPDNFQWFDYQGPLRAKWDAFVAGLPICKDTMDGEDFEYPYDESLALENILGALDLLKWLKRNCKNKLIFQLKAEELGDFCTLTPPRGRTMDLAASKQRMTAKYGDKIAFFCNDLVA